MSVTASFREWRSSRSLEIEVRSPKCLSSLCAHSANLFVVRLWHRAFPPGPSAGLTSLSTSARLSFCGSTADLHQRRARVLLLLPMAATWIIGEEGNTVVDLRRTWGMVG